ncbi:MAG: hypothetical protein ACTHMC_20210 [Pseudobacter sp.]|uniref:helix-turn-helix transcriptional regulator n=1 Tax=Pseudobacter sp. TaxID=2045420 RepID=UPI003F815707
MLNLKPGTTMVFPLTLLLLLLAFRPVIAHPGDSLLTRLARTKKPDQQISILHQLYQLTCFENTYEAEKYMMSAIDIGMRTGSTASLVKSFKLLASLYEQQRNFMQAHLFYQEAQKAAIETDVTEELPLLNYNIGVVLCQLDRYPEALTYLQHAALAAPRQQDLAGKATLFQALCYEEADQTAKARLITDSLMAAAQKNQDQALLSFYYYQLQAFWHKRKELNTAMPLNEAAINILQDNNDHHYAILALKERADMYMAMDSIDQAIIYYRRALSGINIVGAYHYLKPAVLDGLAASYRLSADNMLSQSYERQSKLLRDSLAARGKAATMPIQSASYPGVLPYKKTSVGGLNQWQGRLAPLLLVSLAGLSLFVWLRYRKVKASINTAKASALEAARRVAEQEKQIALRQVYEQLEREKLDAANEARNLVEQVREEARSLQAQIASASVQLANKRDYLQQLQEKLYTSNNEESRRIAREIKSNLNDQDYWAEFIRSFNLLHQNTIDKITRKHPDLTANEVKLTCFVLAGMNNKEIANIFSVEPESVKKARYRLKKKLRLPEEESLRAYLDQLQ